MSAESPEAAVEDSKPNVLQLVRRILAGAGLLGVVLLFCATFATVVHLDVLDSTGQPAPIDHHMTGWDRTGVAMILFAFIGVVMLATALRGSQMAMVVLAAVGVVALIVVLTHDAPHVHDTGSIGDLYDDARSSAGTGFWQELFGSVLLLFAGGGLLLHDFAVDAEREEREPAAAAASAAER